jgi:hypothetical protein
MPGTLRKKRKPFPWLAFALWLLLALLILLAGTTATLIYLVFYKPDTLLRSALERQFAPEEVIVEKVEWRDITTNQPIDLDWFDLPKYWNQKLDLYVENIRIGSRGSIGTARIRVSPSGLLRSEIESIDVDRPTLEISWRDALPFQTPTPPPPPNNATAPTTTASTESTPSDNSATQLHTVPTPQPDATATSQNPSTTTQPTNAITPASPRSPKPWLIRKMRVTAGRLRLTDLGPGIPPIDLPIDTNFDQLLLGGDETSPQADLLQTAELNNFHIVSRENPFQEILHIDQIRLTFTINGLSRRQLQSLEIVGPEIVLSEELFWFTTFVQNQIAEIQAMHGPQPQESGQPWSIGLFQLRAGRLTVLPPGQDVSFTLPVIFTAEQENLVLNSFDELHLKSNITIPSTSRDFPEYDLNIRDLRGQLEFALPRTQQNANNIVNVLQIERLRWQRLIATNLWMSVTFDPQGIYASFGGEAYGGYLNAGLNVYFNAHLDWDGWISATGVQLGPIVEALAPAQAKVRATGEGKIIANGRQNTFEKFSGEFRLVGPSRISILAIDDFLKNLPADWPEINRDAVRALAKSFRDYDADSGRAEFAWSPPRSTFSARLAGRQGKRNFDLIYHHAKE